jgi:hypothetical protein
MAIVPEPSPNPNALKFTVGVPVGGPTTFAAGAVTDDPLAGALLAIPGITSMFMTADFVTLTKDNEADWGDIAPQAVEILESHFEA